MSTFLECDRCKSKIKQKDNYIHIESIQFNKAFDGKSSATFADDKLDFCEACWKFLKRTNFNKSTAPECNQ